MNREDIIRMAREAGAIPIHKDYSQKALVGNENIERFAALVAAVAKAEEREALCKLGEDSRYSHQYVHSFLNTIRARGNTQ